MLIALSSRNIVILVKILNEPSGLINHLIPSHSLPTLIEQFDGGSVILKIKTVEFSVCSRRRK